jgi:Flp pilus assembly protein TadG
MRAGNRQPSDRGPRDGQALIEFALVLPLILLILMGVFDLGRGIFAFNEVANAAREGGRTGIVNQTLADIRTRAADQAIGLGVPTTAPASCPSNGGPPTATTDPAGVCIAIIDGPNMTNCSTTPQVGCVVVVSVKSTFSAVTPIIGNIIGPISLSSTTRQMIEATCSGAGCTSP